MTTRAQQYLRWATVWPQMIWAEKWGECYTHFWGDGSPSNTMRPRPRPTSMPSCILIHPTVWPQCTEVTDRQDRQTDNGPIAYGERFYERSPKKTILLIFRAL